MKGLDLCERYFAEVGAPMINEKFRGYENRVAAGLVGDGSECFGFDDEFSRDHDWGPSFCLWLTKQDFEAIGSDLQVEVDRLPREFGGYSARNESAWGSGRVGVFEIGQFYRKFIGLDRPPESLLEWRKIPEINLAAATNGKVFVDHPGEFTFFRHNLKEFYPEDVRLKKIASRCMTIAQSGQYNYPRCVKREEYVAAQWAETKFITDTISTVFLLNKQYRPFYKWMHRAMKSLPILGDQIHQLVTDLVATHDYNRKAILMEETSQVLIGQLRQGNLSDSESDFLLDHGPIVQSKIQDSQLRSIDVWIE